MENIIDDDSDPWLAPDKFYHFVFCFSLSLLFSTLASLSRYAFLRSHSIWIGSLLSIAAGAAKEAADHLGYFPSAGASARDAVADLLGVLFAAMLLLSRKRWSRSGSDPGQTRRVLPVGVGVSFRVELLMVLIVLRT